MLYAALKRCSSTVLWASAVAAESELRVKGNDNIKVKGKSKIKLKGVGQECPTHTIKATSDQGAVGVPQGLKPSSFFAGLIGTT
jgi:hypothetical protein